MRFRIWAIFYVMALLSAALSTFGGVGVLYSVVVVAFWVAIFSRVQLSTIVVCVVILFFACCCLLFPAVQSARESGRRAQCRNNLKLIALALENYHNVNKSYPPAYTVDKNGKPLHSWRTLILPYYESGTIYDQVDFSEPWNGPNNRMLHQFMPGSFRCPSSEEPDTNTQYLAVIGPRTSWRDGGVTVSQDQMTDGVSNTILILEVHGKNIHWMEPRDISYEEAIQLLAETDPDKAHCAHSNDSFFYKRLGGRNFAMADCSVSFAGTGMTRESAEALLSIDGGEPIGPDDIQYVNGSMRRIKWSRVYSFSVFVILVFLPMPWAIRQWRLAGTPTPAPSPLAAADLAISEPSEPSKPENGS